MRVRAQVVALALATTIVGAAQAQTPFTANTNYIGPFISLATYGSTAAFGGEFEHAINDRWGWGIGADYFSYSVGTDDGSSNVSHFSLAGLGAYHFDAHNDKVDPFVGGAVGYDIVSGGACSGGHCVGGHASGLLIGAFGGVRYWVKENLALTGRLGYGLGYLSVGVDFKM